MSEEIKTYNNIDDVRCPYCGNPVNGRTLIALDGNYAIFVAYCWSGKLYKEKPEHLFRIRVKVNKEVVVEQKKYRKKCFGNQKKCGTEQYEGCEISEDCDEIVEKINEIHTIIHMKEPFKSLHDTPEFQEIDKLLDSIRMSE
jgi:hypothetical protein